MSVDDLSQKAFEVWPENHRSWQIFCVYDGQLVMGMGGPVAINYGPVQHHLDRMKLDPVEFDHVMADIRVLEAAMLAEIHSKE